MRYRAAVLVCMISVQIVAAQARPDFSGAWMRDVEKTRAANPGRPAALGSAMSSLGGASGGAASGGATQVRPAALRTVTIRQTAAAVTIERYAGEALVKTVYALDGSESVNTVGPRTTRMTSRWDGARLISEGTQTVKADDGDRVVKIREVRSLAADGSLHIETTRFLPTGSLTNTEVFSKTGDAGMRRVPFRLAP